MRKRLLLLTALFLCMLAQAQQPTKADLEKQRAALQREIDDVKQSLNETQRNKKASLSQLYQVQHKLQLRQRQINLINQQMNLIEGDINQSWRDIAKLKKELDTLKIQYEKSIVYSYKNRSNYDFLNFLFSSTNFNDALKRVSYLKSYRMYREEQANTIKHTQDQLQQKIAVLNVNREKKTVVLKEENKERSVLEDEKREKDAIVSKLKSREKELNKELADKKRTDQKLAVALRIAIDRARTAAINEARKAEASAAKNVAPATTSTTGTTKAATPAKSRDYTVFNNSTDVKLSGNFVIAKGKLPWPLDKGRISERFGKQEVEGLNKITHNNPGWTFETEAGRQVRSVFDGVVAMVTNIGQNEAVIIRHGKYFTSYSNLGSVSVSKGDQVQQGQVLGKVAENDDGNGELLFVISDEKGQNFDPERWLRSK